jgi:hypothetical protein
VELAAAETGAAVHHRQPHQPAADAGHH